MAGQVVLETERLILRLFREDDLLAYQGMLAAPEVMRFLTRDSRAPDLNQAWRRIAAYVGHWHFRGYGPFAVIERSSGAFVGRVGPWYPAGWPGIELFWAVAPTFWGRGYAAESARSAREFTYRTLGPIRMISLIASANTASLRVAAKLGATYEADLERAEGKVGVYVHPQPPATA